MSDKLVVQWSRLGDLLQSRVLLRNLKKYTREKERVILCCDLQYLEIAKLFPEVDDIWPIDLRKVTALARHQGAHNNLIQVLNVLLSDFAKQEIDTAYVLSESKAAVVFAEMLNPKEVQGYFLKDDQLTKSNILDEYFRKAERIEDCKLTVADIWGKLAPKQTISWLDPLKTERLTADVKRNNILKIGLFTDAGEVYRKIPSKWIELLVNTLNKSQECDITLLGNNAERLSFKDSVNDYRGQLTLSELSKKLVHQDCVIGSDSGGVHLAAALGCSTIGLYFGGANCAYTGVYSNKSLILQDPKWDEETVSTIVKLTSENADTISVAVDYPYLFRPSLEQSGLSYSDNLRRTGISIIIPERGSTHYTAELLRQLDSELLSAEYEIIIISSESFYEHTYCDSAKLKQYFQKTNLSFSEACNLGESHSNYSWLLFLNNDTNIVNGQLVNLFNDLKENTIYSPAILYPDGLIQNQGVEFTARGICEIAHAQKDIKDITYSPDALSAVALLIHRKLFNSLGGFDTKYRNGYEDIDLCQRAKLQGANLKVNLSSSIIHYRSSSTQRFNSESENLELFLSRWSSKFKNKIAENMPATDFTPLLFLSDESKTSAGALLRWIWPFGKMEYKEGKEFSWIKCGESLSENYLAERIDFAETIIVFRPLQSETILHYLLNAVKQLNKTLVTDCDDLILDRFPKNSIRHLTRINYENAYLKLLENSTLITAASEGIQESLTQNGIICDYLPTTANLKMQSEKKVKSDNTFNIGFMGTQSHMIDLAIILPAIEEVLNRNPRVRFYWWGCRPGELIYHPQVRQGGPFALDYETHLHRLHNFPLDLMVVPLSDSEANRAKTPIKYYEYALAGIPCIFSDMAPYNQIVKQNETGILCVDNTIKWIDAIENFISSSLYREQIADKARMHVTDLVQSGSTHSLFSVFKTRDSVDYKCINKNTHSQLVKVL